MGSPVDYFADRGAARIAAGSHDFEDDVAIGQDADELGVVPAHNRHETDVFTLHEFGGLDSGLVGSAAGRRWRHYFGAGHGYSPGGRVEILVPTVAGRVP